MLSRRGLISAAAGAASLPAIPGQAMAAPAQVLRIGMTASDLPTTHGIPNNGGEGFRFLGYPAYDATVNWDFTKPKNLADITPGLFTTWQADEANPLRWVCQVRKGVTFHDGSELTADAIIWNFRRVYDDKSPQYDATASPIVRATVSMLDRFEKADDGSIVLTTKYPFSFFPYLLPRLLIASPTQWEAVGKTWAEFSKKPSGTGPFRITKVVPGQYAEMTRNETYWDKARIPKLDKLVVYPMPESTTRVAALRSGQVDWIEVPPPDAIPSLRQAGFQISLWPYPHTYPYAFNCLEGSPFADVRVRRAMNYAVDREGLVKLLNGSAKPAAGLYPPDDPIFGNPANKYTFDPDRAKALLKEAGYGPGKPVKAKIMISTSGSGQMMPIPMNELIQRNLEQAYFKIDFDVVEWGQMLLGFRQPPDSTINRGRHAMNISLTWTDPSVWFRWFHSAAATPVSSNWGHWKNENYDRLLDKVANTFDPAEVDKLLAQAHEILVEESPWLWIVHDLNPRAFSPKVRGYRPVQSWMQDFTQVSLE